MKYILALDQGTTSSRAVIVDEAGAIKAMAQKELRQIFPQPGWVEHDPEDIWTTQMSAVAEALSTAGMTATDLAGVGLSNQRETTLVWERKSGTPICNAIVWQDRRTAATCDRLSANGLAPLIQAKTGLRPDPYFSASKLRWILENVPDARQRAEAGELAFGTVDSWLAWKLSGGRLHVTDVSNASRTMLFNIHKGTWDEELLDLFSIPRPMLPEVRASSEVCGEATDTLSGVPIAGMAGDQQAALFGQACIEPGTVKSTYGTGCFLLMHTGTQTVTSKNNLVTTVAWRIGHCTEYALEGSIFVAGAVVHWLRDGLGVIRSAADVEGVAARVADAGGVFLVPAFAGLGAPHWDPHARGAIVGLTRGTTIAHIARAALEGIAFQVADVMVAMESDTGLQVRELRADGGAATNNLLLQIQADLLGVPVVRPTVSETTALGAAFLAGLAVGCWKDQTEIAKQWSVDRRFEPTMTIEQRQQLRAGWAKAVGCVRGWGG